MFATVAMAAEKAAELPSLAQHADALISLIAIMGSLMAALFTALVAVLIYIWNGFKGEMHTALSRFEGSIEKLGQKIEAVADRQEETDKTLAILKSQHDVCFPARVVSAANNTTAGH